MKELVWILSGESRCSEDEIDSGLFHGDADEWVSLDELGQFQLPLSGIFYEDDAFPDEGLAPWEPDWDDD